MSWSVLQSKSHTAIASATVAATFGTNLTSGTKLIAVVSTSGGSNADPSSVQDGSGNTFTKVASVTRATALNLWLGYLDTPAGDVGTTPTITATVAGGGSDDASILVQEVSGLASGGADGTAGTLAPQFGPGTYGPPAYPSAAANEYLVYAYGDGGGPRRSPPGPHLLARPCPVPPAGRTSPPSPWQPA